MRAPVSELRFDKARGRWPSFRFAHIIEISAPKVSRPTRRFVFERRSHCVYSLTIAERAEHQSVPLRGNETHGENAMAKDAHSKAAEHHESAARSHKMAAEHHGKGDHAKGLEESSKAQSHSNMALDQSEMAHGKSQSHK